MSIANDPTGKYVLKDDIDLSNISNWEPIGTTKGSAFKGILEGDGHVIRGLSVYESFNSGTIMSPSYTAGLFGVCDGAVIRNLGLENVNVTINTTSGYRYVSNLDSEYTVFAGAIAGFAQNNTKIYNCYASGSVQARASGEGYSPTIAGGLVGYGNNITIRYSRNYCSVTAYNGNAFAAYDAIAGGIVGRAGSDGTILISQNSGKVTAQTLDYGKSYAGGLIGFSSASGFEIADAYNDAEVKGLSGNNFCDPAYAGGISAKYSGHITRCYNSGPVTAQAADPYWINYSSASAGGICGEAETASVISNCASAGSQVYASASGSKSQFRISKNGNKSNNITNSLMTSGSSNDAEKSVPESQLKQETVWNSDLGWDFATVWMINDDYPKFQKIFDADDDYSASLDWFITDDGELIISGKGDMPDWASIEDVPWHLETSRIKKIEIGDGITSIGANAFYWCANCREIVIGSAIQRIGESAFTGCLKVSELVIPENIETIDGTAFMACGATKYTFTGNAPEINDTAFLDVSADVYYHSDVDKWDTVAEKNYSGILNWVDLYLVENGMIDPASFVKYKKEKKEGTLLTNGSLPATPSANVSQYSKELYKWGCDYGYSDILTEEVCDEVVRRYMPTVLACDERDVFTEDEYRTWEIMRDVLMLNSMKNSLNLWESEYLTRAENIDLTKAQDQLTKIIDVYTKYTDEVKRNPISTAVYNIYSLKIVNTPLKAVWKVAKDKTIGYEKELVENTIKTCEFKDAIDFLSETACVIEQGGLESIALSIGGGLQDAWDELVADRGKSIVKEIKKSAKDTIIETAFSLNPTISELRDFYKAEKEYVGLFKKYSFVGLYAPEVILYVELIKLGQQVIDAANDSKISQYFMIQYYLLHKETDLYDQVIVDEEGNIIDEVEWVRLLYENNDIDPLFQQLMTNWYKKGNESIVTKEDRSTVAVLASTASCLQNMSPEEMKRAIVDYWVNMIIGSNIANEIYQIQFKTDTNTQTVIVDRDGKEIATYSPEQGFVPIIHEEDDITIASISANAVPSVQSEDILFITDEDGRYNTASIISEDYGIRIENAAAAVGVDVKTTNDLKYANVYNNIPAGTVIYVVDGEIRVESPEHDVLDPIYEYTKEQDKVREDLSILELGFQDDDTADSVTEDIILPLHGRNGSTISWDSDKPEILSSEGFVNRDWEKSEVTLTATAVLNGYTASREFTLIVKGRKTKLTCLSMVDGSILGSMFVEEGSFVPQEQLEALIPKEAEFAGWFYDKNRIFPYHEWETIQEETILYADYVIDEELHFTKQPVDGTYLMDEIPVNLCVDYYPKNGGSIQWYVSESMDAEGTPLEGENNEEYTPDTSEAGIQYYYVLLQYGETIVISNRACIKVIDPNIIMNGSCGEQVNWQLDSNGNLVISGTGEMEEYANAQDAPWYSCKDKITSIIIQEGVTRIGNNAFVDLAEVKMIDAADSVTYIPEGVFSGCEAVEKISIPFVGMDRNASGSESVLGVVFGKVSSGGTVQYDTLNGTQLTGYRYAIPASLKDVEITDADRIGFGAFYNCNNLQSIKLNEGITSIGQYAFRYCSGLSEMVIPVSVEHIFEGALNGCESLNMLTVPYIGSNASANNDYDAVLGVIFGRETGGTAQYYRLEGTSLTGAPYAIPAALKKLTVTNEQRIPIGAFCNCSYLEELHLSADISEIGLYSFYNCTSLTDIYYDASEDQWNGIEKDLIGNDVLETVTMHFKEPSVAMHKVHFETGDGSAIEDMEVIEGDLLTKPDDPFLEGFVFTGWYLDDERTILYDFQQSVVSDLTLYAGWQEDTDEDQPEEQIIIFKAAVSEIADEAFMGCENIKKVYFEGDMPAFGNDAFKGISEDAVFYYPVNNSTWSEEKLREAGITAELSTWEPDKEKTSGGLQAD